LPTLTKRGVCDRIESVWVGSKPEPLKSTAAEICVALEGAQVERVQRVGKHIVFDLESGKNPGSRQWIVHLGMTGKMLVATPETEVPKHTHLVARLDSGRELRFVDPRRFGRLEVRNSSFSGPGAEPLQISVEELRPAAIAARRRSKRPCSTRSCCTVWGTSTPMKRCSTPIYGRAAAPALSLNLNCASCMRQSKKS
jgi:formamidopyrimidine-DNA glycosylase